MSSREEDRHTMLRHRGPGRNLGTTPFQYDENLQLRYQQKVDEIRVNFDHAMLNKAEIDDRIRGLKRKGPTEGRLHRAAHWGRLEEVQILLDDGHDVNALDREQKTALDLSVLGESMAQKMQRDTADFKSIQECLILAGARGGDEVISENERGVALEYRKRNMRILILSSSFVVGMVALVLRCV